MGESISLGVDIGGSHMTAALADVGSRTLIADSIVRSTVDSAAPADVIFDTWYAIIRRVYGHEGTLVKRIGIAMPGPFDYENGICLIQEQAKFKALYGLNLKQELASRLAVPQSAVHFMNDAAAFLQGEVFAGECRDAKCVIGFTLGTGLGAAVCTDGKAVDAALWDAPFLEGIAEDYLSTRWFVKRYQELSGNTIAGVKDLAALPLSEAAVQQVFNEFGHNFASFLIPLIKKYKAEAVIIGGNIARTFNSFSPRLIGVLEQHRLKTPVIKSILGEQAALLGAASYAAGIKL
jgi:glucokinase